MLPTFKQLQYLVALAEHLHFRRAAAACYVTQPALSEQLKQLEEMLGARLVERSQRRVMLTPVGEEVVARARALLTDMAELAESARRASEPFAHPVRLGVIPTIASYMLPPILRRLREAEPALQLYLREDQTAVLLRQLREGRLDLLLLAVPIDAPDMEVDTLLREPFFLVTPRGHELAGRRAVRQQDLAGQRVLLLEEGHCLREQALEICRAVNPAPVEEFRANSLGTLVQMVANGLGVTLLPRMAVEVELRGQEESLAVVPFADPPPERRVGLVWRRRSARREEFVRLGLRVRELLRPPAVEWTGAWKRQY